MSVTTTGFEKAFIENWEEWDQASETCFVFFDCELTDESQLFTGSKKADTVVINLDSCTVEFFRDSNRESHYKASFELKLIKE